MKNLFSLIILVIFTVSFSFAQSKSKSTSTTRSSSKTNVKISMSGGDGLNLKINNSDFDMDIDFGKKETLDIRNLLTKYLGTPDKTSRGKEIWKGANGMYDIRLSKGNLEASFDKDDLTQSEVDDIRSFAKDVFMYLGWEVDLDAL